MPSHLLTALERDVVEGARTLLGCFLIRGGRKARIVEVEAYRGRDDPGSHAFRGPTPRTQIMFGPPGVAYVYFTYGCHWMLNVVAEKEGTAGAVLIRAAEPIEGIEEMRALRERPKAVSEVGVRLAGSQLSAVRLHKAQNLLSGPAKLAAAFGITGQDNGTELLSGTPLSRSGGRGGQGGEGRLRIAPGEPVSSILVGTRIGLAEGKGRETPWRFADADALKWVSRPLTF